jgi:uncharacterized protein (DUF2267 family)
VRDSEDAMDYQGFITTVQQTAQMPVERAEDLACFTLRTLARRVPEDEARGLAERLPEKLRSCLAPEGLPEKFTVDELVRRVEQHQGVDRSTAERETRAVLAALRRAVGPEAYAALRDRLPKDFHPLLDAAVLELPPDERAEPAAAPAMTLDEFLDRVAERAGLDRDAARRAAEAVLEALAMRITGGQVGDLEALLPPELRPALERGSARSGGRALSFKLGRFIDEIKDVEGVTEKDANVHARAVLAVLREAVGEKEFHDTTAQLPGEFRILLKSG